MKAATRDWIAKAENDYLAAVDLAGRRKYPQLFLATSKVQKSKVNEPEKLIQRATLPLLPDF